MIYPHLWLRHWRVRRALGRYPLYDVPHKVREGDLPEEKARENFEYFMAVRLERLAFFQSWLGRRFGVDASLTPAGVKAVDGWVDAYGGGLVGDFPQVKEPDSTEPSPLGIFARYARPWEGQNAGLNVAVDLGIFMGEYCILKRPKLYWEMYQGHAIEPATFRSTGYRRPCLAGFRGLWKSDTITAGYECLANSRGLAKIGHSNLSYRKNVVVECVKSILYDARLADADQFMEDSSHEPL
jgi:hypothetical protein